MGYVFNGHIIERAAINYHLVRVTLFLTRMTLAAHPLLHGEITPKRR